MPGGSSLLEGGGQELQEYLLAEVMDIRRECSRRGDTIIQLLNKISEAAPAHLRQQGELSEEFWGAGPAAAKYCQLLSHCCCDDCCVSVLFQFQIASDYNIQDGVNFECQCLAGRPTCHPPSL